MTDTDNPRVVVIVKPGCHLCDDALAVVASVCAEGGVGWMARQLAELPPDEQERWLNFVPVVELDGKVFETFRVDRARLAAALSSSAT